MNMWLLVLLAVSGVRAEADPEAESATQRVTTPAPGYGSSRLVRHMAASRVFNHCFGSAKHRAEGNKLTEIHQKCKKSSPTEFTRNPPLRPADIRSGSNMTTDDMMFRRIQYRLANYSCILENLQFTDKKNVLDINAVKKYVTSLPNDESVRKMIDGDITDCYDYSKMVPNRLVMNSINEYKFLDETWVRLGIFFHCMRGRLMMVCMEKQTKDNHQPMSPLVGLAMARIPFFMLKDYVFEDMFTVIDESALWFSSAP